MAPLRSLALYLLVVFIGGALLAPWLFYLSVAGQTLPGLKTLAQNPFPRFVDRSLLLIALLALWPFLRSLGIERWRDVGLGQSSRAGRLLGQGLSVGLLSLAVGIALLFIAGVRSFNSSRTGGQMLTHFINAAAAAAAVAMLEELLFRGALFTGLKRVYRWPIALLLSSALYALVHFFRRPEASPEVYYWSGLALLPRMMRGFGDVNSLVPAFFSLLLAGAILTLAYEKTGSLYFSIGLHAGWVFWLKSFSFFTEQRDPSTALWGTDKLVDGWLAFFVLLGTGLLIYIWRPIRDDGVRP